MSSGTIFLTTVGSPAEKAAARLLIDSLQTFGGRLSGCRIWVFASNPDRESCRDLADANVEVLLLEVPAACKHYPFSSKVYACVQAEKQAPPDTQSLVWLDAECLVVQPPQLFELSEQYDAAFRPVHHRNVGSLAIEQPDAFWSGIYREMGVRDVPMMVESFIGRERLRAYFNTHGFGVRPGLGLCHRWAEHFERLVTDEGFQRAACSDELHQIFLFQAVLSALAATSIDERRIRILPESYNYPYNLQDRVRESQRAAVMNDLVTIAYEGRSIHPGEVTDIKILEPLRGWLEKNVTPGGFQG